ncbi:hypothetical protein, partial [Bosea sp. (in: a-proteobacteria)]|uniref:hypothetical protein n=1 Tax=Bosea sp. (in: a-proteobacteria) TaxID=1871050 RepID=UPI0031FF329E
GCLKHVASLLQCATSDSAKSEKIVASMYRHLVATFLTTKNHLRHAWGKLATWLGHLGENYLKVFLV